MIPQLENMGRSERRAAIRKLERDNSQWPERLSPFPLEPFTQDRPAFVRPFSVWRSREFLVQAFDEGDGLVRLTVSRTTVDEKTLRWNENITWDQLQYIKNEVGYADREAVEIYPPKGSEVNVANMRHLWVMRGRMAFSWKKS